MNRTITGKPLAKLAASAAHDGLSQLTERGLNQYWHERGELMVVMHALWVRSRDTTFDLFPRGPGQRDYYDDHGIFARMHLLEILHTCFAADAVDFLVQHCYNRHIFWMNVFFALDPDTAMPYSLKHVRERVLTIRPPMGLGIKPQGDAVTALLRSAAAANGGTLDPNKLPAALAYDLIRDGFVLRRKTEVYTDPSVLVVCPMWEHLLLDINSPPDAQLAADGTFLLVGRHQTGANLKIKPPPGGETVAQILAGFNEGRYEIVGNAVHEKPANINFGSRVVAEVVQQVGYVPDTSVWSVGSQAS